MQPNIERMMRLNGKKPTRRELWQAFYRLYRLSKKTPLHGNEAIAALYVLGFYGWLRLVNGNGDRLASGLPVFMRRRYLEMEKRKRLEESDVR